MAEAKAPPPPEAPPEDFVATYNRILKEAAERLPALGLELNASLLLVPKRPQQAVPVLRGLLESLRNKMIDLLGKLDSLLGPRPGSGGGAGDDAQLQNQMLEQLQRALAEARRKLFEAEQDRDLARGAVAEREQQTGRLQALVNDLQKRIGELEALAQRQPVEPAGLGSALGEAVDAIQGGLTSLRNPLIDYGLQEFDLETQVNVEVGTDGRLRIRFPGFNEAVSAQSLSRLSLRLRPIPKSQNGQDIGPAQEIAVGK